MLNYYSFFIYIKVLNQEKVAFLLPMNALSPHYNPALQE
jgi:hypothetical protein